MKKLAIIIIGLVTIVACTPAHAETRNTYKADATVNYYERVEEPTHTEYEVHVTTEDGNEWVYVSNRKMHTGQALTITFDTNGTTEVEDDMIVKVRKVRA